MGVSEARGVACELIQAPGRRHPLAPLLAGAWERRPCLCYLSLPLAGAIHEARVCCPRAAVGPAGRVANAQQPRPWDPAGARGGSRSARRALHTRPRPQPKRRASRAITAGTARVVERPGRIRGYASGIGYGGHAVAETNEQLIALLGSAGAFMGLGIIIPSRNAELLRWCLDQGLRIVQQSTLMTIGLYNEPAGAYLPSIVF